jgi:hypothetical protein
MNNGFHLIYVMDGRDEVFFYSREKQLWHNQEVAGNKHRASKKRDVQLRQIWKLDSTACQPAGGKWGGLKVKGGHAAAKPWTDLFLLQS